MTAPVARISMLLLASQAAAVPFECSVGAVGIFSPEKTAWCCRHENVGCTYDCEAGYDNWMRGWSVRKKQWCCEEKDRGCVEPYDCEAPQGAKQQSWCCRHRGRACPPALTSNPYDCTAGVGNWLHGWSDGKKAWCCEHHGLGCLHHDACDAPCHFAGETRTCRARIQWSAWHRWSKEERPCLKAQDQVGSQCAACSGCAFADAKCVPFDCGADLATWERSWTPTQKSWCCQTHGKGCAGAPPAVSTTPAPPAPVPEGPSQGCEASCSVNGKSATCKYRVWWALTHGRFQSQPHACPAAHDMVLRQCPSCVRCALQDAGCPGAPNDKPLFDCNAEFDKWQISWAAPKKDFCCKTARRGCPIGSTTSPPFDCAAGISNWRAGWSQGKKDWCCHEARVCPGQPTTPAPSTTPPPATTPRRFDCLAGLGNWERGWAPEKKAWCCQHSPPHGCPTTTPGPPATSAPFDCEAGIAKWRTGWSARKKSWCCKNLGRGCETTTPAPPYDCEAGLSNWRAGWSEPKKAWCCENLGHGCDRKTAVPTSLAPPFDCAIGVGNWRHLWSEPQKIWCCHALGVGCEDRRTTTARLPAFDCDSPIPTTWSAEKSQWCCRQVGKGCPVPTADPCASTSTLPPTTPAGQVAPWNCHVADVGVWTDSEKAWCCHNLGLGCVGVIVQHPGDQPLKLSQRFGTATTAAVARLGGALNLSAQAVLACFAVGAVAFFAKAAWHRGLLRAIRRRAARPAAPYAELALQAGPLEPVLQGAVVTARPP